ncbi:S9 family peptidase [Moheibacter lacus]|uniref:Proline-specific endopeptidase n=1 Tax=Moheibacter lacus TaxID=2745851 RepID=A0A838ZKS9_9FLAO|nr:S9 family peptidase [Moheibacter lacus]MBA5628290.1 S9 family peptidase [Moheibacter lacus]
MKIKFSTVLLTLSTFALLNAQNMQAPKAKKIDKKLEIHGDVRTDEYYWLNQRENPEVIDYLNAENAYTDAMLKDTEKFQKDLFEEIKGRIKEDDSSVPYKYNGYWYVTRFEKGGEYPIHTRKKESLDAKEEILFDVNEMAKPFSYYNLNGLNVSENNQLVAFGQDTLSRRIYTIQIKDLKTGKILSDKLENTTGGSVWATDNQTLFYTRKDATLRSYQIWKHKLGTPQSEDQLIFEESDETFGTYVYKTKSKKYIIIGSSSTVSNEYRFIPADQPNAEWKVLQPRERDLEFSIEHYGNDFYILTNKDKATNFKLMKTPVDKPGKENWVDVIPHRKDVYLENFEIFNDYLVLEERTNGLTEILINSWDGKTSYKLPFKEEVYTAYISYNPEFDSKILRYGYTSMTTPNSTIDFNMVDKTSEVKKEQPVLGDFKKENYKTKRLWVTARDGVKVPVSIVYRKDTKISQKTPVLLYAYGSYGATMDPYFSSSRLSLLDRGFIYALAHIRGGQDLGRPWYDDGKMLKKKNTFNDFVDVSKYLIDEQYTCAQHLYAMGGSAGGLLMGAIINQAPELYNGVVAQVPFVDVVTTMLDDSIPLTTGEYDEWGNPNDKVYYDYMKSYSPYDNIEKKNYPNMLVTTGLHDSQVQYWEPAKWVARLRDLKTDDNLLILKTDMETGHGGASGRFEALKEIALEYAFIFKLEGITE